MSAPDRAAILAAWRAVIDVLEQDEALPLPVFGGGSGRIIFHLYGRPARAQMAALEALLPCELAGHVSRAGDEYQYQLTGDIGGVPLTVVAPVDSVAEKRVTGTRVIEKVEWVRRPVEPENSEGDQ